MLIAILSPSSSGPKKTTKNNKAQQTTEPAPQEKEHKIFKRGSIIQLHLGKGKQD